MEIAMMKFGQSTKSNKIWYENGSDAIEKDVGFDVRLLVKFQSKIPAETNTLLVEVLLNKCRLLRCHCLSGQ
jgi:hypothetical protein